MYTAQKYTFYVAEYVFMRRIVLCMVLAVMIFTVSIGHASEVPANPFTGFGLYIDYVTNGSVKLNASGMPDYSEVKSFVADGISLGGTLKPGANASSLPIGTLTVLSGDNAGIRYRLRTCLHKINDS